MVFKSLSEVPWIFTNWELIPLMFGLHRVSWVCFCFVLFLDGSEMVGTIGTNQSIFFVFSLCDLYICTSGNVLTSLFLYLFLKEIYGIAEIVTMKQKMMNPQHHQDFNCSLWKLEGELTTFRILLKKYSQNLNTG